MTNNALAADRRSTPPPNSTRRTAGLGRAIAAKVAKMTMLGAMLTVAFVALGPSAASANCEVPEVSDVPVNPYSPFEIGNTRSSLNAAGVDVGGAYYAEPFYNWGGTDEGGEYQGVLELYVNANMQKLGLWRGLCFHANGYQIHGNSITGANIGGLMPVTSLEAEDATRLFEIWFEQSMFNDRVSVRFGQLAADEEFFAADGGGYFINGTWGWAPIAAENNPGGGPAYPLATPGVRVSWDTTDNLNLKVGVYNGDPAPQCNKADGDPQRCNDHGLDFELDDDPLLMAEATYGYELAGGRLPGTLRIGGWNHFGTFQHQRVDVGGNLVAITGNDGRPLDNDWALYGIIDQLIWRVPGSEDPHGVAIFARFAGAPEDRNLVDFYFDAGFTFTGMMAGRPNDALAIGFAYTGISDDVSAFDVDTGAVAARDYESLIEIAYTFEVNDWWVLQPDFQYIWNPAGEPGLDDATVVGARSTMTF